MPQDDPPALDPSLLSFPTDRITLGAMRAHEPELFTRRALQAERQVDIEGIALYSHELRLAELAFALALGQPIPDADEQRSQNLAVVNDTYQQYGLSSGSNHTEELVRSLEREAAKQAEHFRAR